mgnify:CR=1 FL=1
MDRSKGEDGSPVCVQLQTVRAAVQANECVGGAVRVYAQGACRQLRTCRAWGSGGAEGDKLFPKKFNRSAQLLSRARPLSSAARCSSAP